MRGQAARRIVRLHEGRAVAARQTRWLASGLPARLAPGARLAPLRVLAPFLDDSIDLRGQLQRLRPLELLIFLK